MVEVIRKYVPSTLCGLVIGGYISEALGRSVPNSMWWPVATIVAVSLVIANLVHDVREMP